MLRIAVPVAASLIVCLLPAAQADAQCTQSSFDSTDVPKSIPDPPGSAEATLSVPDGGSIEDVDVSVDIAHPFDSDLRVEVVSPASPPVTLAEAVGMWGDDFSGTSFDDEAATSVISELPPFTGSFRPAQPLSELDGADPTGVWKVRVTDRHERYDGTIEAFGLDISICDGTRVEASQLSGAADRAGAPQTPPPLPAGVPAGDEGTEGTPITVTTDSDASDGDTSSVADLQATPGADGEISLREAIEATNNDPGTWTVEFAAALDGATIERASGYPDLGGGGLFINGDSDGDGTPNVTVTDPVGVNPVGFLITSGGNRLHALELEGFDRAVAFFHASGEQTYAQNVLSGLVITAAGEGVDGFGNTAEPDTKWTDTRLVGNAIESSNGISLFQLTGGETAERLTIAGNTLRPVEGEAAGASIGLFSGHGAHANRMSDVWIAYNGSTSGIGVASGSSGGDSNTVERLRIFGNHIHVQSGTAIGVGLGDGAGPVGFPEDNLMSDVEISGNAVDARMGVWVTGGCCGAAGGTLEHARVRGNVITATNEAGIYVPAATTGGELDQASAQNLVNDVVVDSNTIEHTQPAFGGIDPGSLLWGGIVLAGGTGADDGKVVSARISDNLVDSDYIGIDVIGGVGRPDDLPASDNQVSQLDLEGNVVTGPPVNVTAEYPWARGISFIGGIEEATGNSVSCEHLAGNLVAGVPNAVGVQPDVGTGASGNTVTLGPCAASLPPDGPGPPPPVDGGPPAEDGNATPPDTTITGGPKAKTKKKSATFEFTSTEPGSTFECSLDGKTTFEACTSPLTVKVKKGSHTFQVGATDSFGNADPSPASRSWKVKKKKS